MVVDLVAVLEVVDVMEGQRTHPFSNAAVAVVEVEALVGLISVFVVVVDVKAGAW